MTAENSMKEAAVEICNKSLLDNHPRPDNSIVDTSISCDGSWQKQGYSSLNGFVAALSMESGKVLDIEPMSRYCKACALKEKLKKENIAEYEEWKANHSCFINYLHIWGSKNLGEL